MKEHNVIKIEFPKPVPYKVFIRPPTIIARKQMAKMVEAVRNNDLIVLMADTDIIVVCENGAVHKF
jgi:NADH:ubiquinone oxidoreductase subunit D